MGKIRATLVATNRSAIRHWPLILLETGRGKMRPRKLRLKQLRLRQPRLAKQGAGTM